MSTANMEVIYEPMTFTTLRLTMGGIIEEYYQVMVPMIKFVRGFRNE